MGGLALFVLAIALLAGLLSRNNGRKPTFKNGDVLDWKRRETRNLYQELPDHPVVIRTEFEGQVDKEGIELVVFANNKGKPTKMLADYFVHRQEQPVAIKAVA
jgi:hypothetical protein